MSTIEAGALLWTPSADAVARARLTHYLDWLARERGLRFSATTPEGYDRLWTWSTTDLEAFWTSVWDHFDLRASTPFTQMLGRRTMPGAQWLVGARLNYVDQVMRHVEQGGNPDRPAIRYASETAPLADLSWRELRRRVAALADALRRMGVVPGDRVAAYLPNTPDAIVAFLATASVGAIWSVCAPDMGQVAVADRFRQIEPKVLIAVDGYHYGGRAFDRTGVVAEMLAALPSVGHLVLVPQLHGGIDRARFPRALDWRDLSAGEVPLVVTPVASDHPLWILYSSGTTGMPKPIVHGHGGLLLVQTAMGALHLDLGPDDVYHWYSSTGWVMWNAQVSGLLAGATLALYDGNPGTPDLNTLWRFAQEAGVTFFGAGAAFFANCLKAGIEPGRNFDLSKLRAVGSTGSPLSAEAYDWIYRHVKADVWLNPISGGTDFAGCFVGGVPTLPVHAGEMQCRNLGSRVEALDETGKPRIDAVGELVCTAPIPSMPLFFWGDADGSRYRDSYFDMYPGLWRHGDWIRITPRGGAIIYGRSDATINRHGIRMGTAELYRVVEDLPEVLDSLVVDLEFLGRESFMPLFVVLRDNAALDDALRSTINARIRAGLSARHVPSVIVQAPGVPRTLSGKKMEVPIKKLLLGAPPERIANPDAMANPEVLAWYVEYARALAAPSADGGTAPALEAWRS
ncbi:acetoacetate--CoA ligase [Ralstonia solanacearum]|uniref:acetoacetate--CoA ligase n=1 Tax=Ralstonia solanacearum TaxID=305 RepID=UPI00078E998C|nr:acetoacetate--CoA ligase [Ralstonia solanacearum]AMP38358.1 acetoacetyl-CoA synthetase [Ralstonia solanacearum]AXV87188.1 acetoacetate--CoA ligase [Ralstonia solanacearum]AXW06677.1 acetoacetate--CoA ligase [Ralstonia solanacearum]AXW24419.1 acetoacetate--CoA ligase [Ralstonia solanacearum]AXW81356.1 acetoacetate--CoA ligase [Ralstonia solanacearum]